jgi:hypothetical protein
LQGNKNQLSMTQGESMAYTILQVEYYNIIVPGRIADASEMLSTIAAAGVDFHAFKATPLGPGRTQFTLFAKDSSRMVDGAGKSGLELQGPHSALLIKGDERSGALADIYRKLSRAGIQVDEASGIADINAGYGVILYLQREDCARAMTVLNA